MLFFAALCVVAVAVFADAEEVGVQPSATQAAFRHSGLYDTHYDPLSNIASAKPLSHIPEHYRRYACTVDGNQYYEHGALFRISYETRCVTYRCEYGAYQIYQDGCLDISNQRCVPVGYTWTIRCHTFLCSKTVTNGMLLYQGVRNNIACYDEINNRCVRENEFFAYIDNNGVRRDRCTCKIIPGATKIICFGNNNRANYMLQQN